MQNILFNIISSKNRGGPFWYTIFVFLGNITTTKAYGTMYSLLSLVKPTKKKIVQKMLGLYQSYPVASTGIHLGLEE